MRGRRFPRIVDHEGGGFSPALMGGWRLQDMAAEDVSG